MVFVDVKTNVFNSKIWVCKLETLVSILSTLDRVNLPKVVFPPFRSGVGFREAISLLNRSNSLKIFAILSVVVGSWLLVSSLVVI